MNDGAILAVLSVAFHNRVIRPTAEAGFEAIRGMSKTDFDDAVLADSVAACVRDGLIREPIRLPEGALQCHWHLELTPAGVVAARQMLTNQSLD
jgi:hypothetical protein